MHPYISLDIFLPITILNRETWLRQGKPLAKGDRKQDGVRGATSQVAASLEDLSKGGASQPPLPPTIMSLIQDDITSLSSEGKTIVSAIVKA